MKIRHIILTLLLIIPAARLSAQSDFAKYRDARKQDFTNYKTQRKNDFKAYRDSLNRKYADFLEQKWEQYALQKPEPQIKNPISRPPRFDQSQTIPTPENVRGILPPTISKPGHETLPEIPQVRPQPIAPAPSTVEAVLFGTDIELRDLHFTRPTLGGVAEKSVADYWRALVDTPYVEMIDDALRIKEELNLNGWGVYQLLQTIWHTYVPDCTENEKVIFSVFALNQMGYRAKIGRCGNELISLIAFSNSVTNCMYLRYGGGNLRYYTINPRHKSLSSVQTCTADYTDGLALMSLNMDSMPLFDEAPITKRLTCGSGTYTIQVNANLVDFYSDYPCIEFAAYARAQLDPLFMESIETQLRPIVSGLSQIEAVNKLLNFVQFAFDYKTDDEQFGYEKFFFAEETIASSFSDCEDRAILFSQLVRRLLGMPVALIYYPGVHLAAAVKFDDGSIDGDNVIVGGIKYLICDPTYIGADAGNSMPQLSGMTVEVIKID